MPDNQESPSKELDAHKGGDLGDKLLPCPFCNAPAKFTDGKYSNGHQYADGKVQCVECDAELYATNAIQVWNTRASSKQLTATQQALDTAADALKLVHKNSKSASSAARNILSDIEKSRIKDKDFTISRLERIIDFMEPLIGLKAALASIKE